MARRGRLSILWLAFAGGLLVLLGSSLLVLWGATCGELDLGAARSRWARRPFTHYRMDLEYGLLGYCS